MKYTIEWMDGRGARSRGMEDDNIVTQTISCNSDMLGIILLAVKDLGFINKNIYNESAHLIDDKNLIKELSEKYSGSDLDDFINDTYNVSLDDYLDGINLEDIDGGAPWVIKIDYGHDVIYQDEDYEDYDDEDVELDDCKFKDSDYLEHLITTLENDIYNLAYSKSNSSEERCYESLYADVQEVCDKSFKEVRASASMRGRFSIPANMSIANKLLDLSKHFESVSKKARTKSASIKILALSETLLKSSKMISKAR